MIAHGIVHKYGDHVDTDVIIPARYLNTQSHKELASHCMEDIDKDFIHRVKDGDIMVAGVNFGCGSSREQAPEGLSALKISCIIAKSFARIFFRNAINNGLLLIECPNLPDHCEEGDTVRVEINHCIYCNGKEYAIPSMPDNLFEIIKDGGLVKHMQKLNHLKQ